MNADAILLKNLEALSRGAALRAIQEPGSGLGFENDVEKCLLSGIATGDLSPISEREFESELEVALSQPMNGMFSKMKKKLKKLGKKLSPKKLVKRVVKVTKKVASKTFKAVKKVAPYAAAGAALYFGAPYLMKGGSFLYDKAKGMIGGALSPAIEGGKEVGGSFLTKAATQKATQFATNLLSGQGINMQSPESQVALRQYMGQQTEQMMPPPPRVVQPRQGQYAPAPPKTDMMKYALPAAGVLAAVLLLK